MNFNTKSSRGITLIALVITIIVLLILAGISISMLSGDNGILQRATDAKEQTEIAQREEEIQLNYLASLSNPWDGTIANSFSSSSGNGDTEQSPYVIENGEQLAYLASQVNSGNTFEGKYISITNSINLGDIEFTPIGYGGNSGTDSNAQVFTTGRIFQGTLDGNNNIIYGLKIGKEEMLQLQGIGLVGVLGEKGTVKNIKLYDSNVRGAYMVGGIVGAMKSGGIIQNCENRANVYAVETNNDSGGAAGGICGYTSGGSIDGCINYGNVDAPLGNVGGIKGQGTCNTISNCANYGTVDGGTGLAGGICASSSENVTGCTNSGSITAMYASGICAYMSGNLTNCTNSGSISATTLTGGICAYMLGNSTNCTNSGSVAATEYAGGICAVAYGKGLVITDVYNDGQVQGTTAGGIIGMQGVQGSLDYSLVNLLNAYNKGEVIGSGTNVGAVVGELNEGATIVKAFYINENLPGVGNVVEGSNSSVEVAKLSNSTENFNSLSDYINWAKANGKYATMENE